MLCCFSFFLFNSISISLFLIQYLSFSMGPVPRFCVPWTIERYFIRIVRERERVNERASKKDTYRLLNNRNSSSIFDHAMLFSCFRLAVFQAPSYHSPLTLWIFFLLCFRWCVIQFFIVCVNASIHAILSVILVLGAPLFNLTSSVFVLASVTNRIWNRFQRL